MYHLAYNINILRDQQVHSQEENMPSSARSASPRNARWITILIWVLGLALLFARKWLGSLFHLNTEWFMASSMGPLWALMLVVLLAGFLRIFRRPAEKWSRPWRTLFACVALLVLALPQIDLIMAMREGLFFPQNLSGARLQVLLVTAVVFYLLPAAVVVLSWLNHNRLVSAARALGLSLLLHGLVYVPYGLWLNELIKKNIVSG
jgi:hypothetical protein